MAKIEKHAPAPHRVLGRCLLNLTSAPWRSFLRSQGVSNAFQTCKTGDVQKQRLASKTMQLFCRAQVLDMSVFQGKVATSMAQNSGTQCRIFNHAH